MKKEYWNLIKEMSEGKNPSWANEDDLTYDEIICKALCDIKMEKRELYQCGKCKIITTIAPHEDTPEHCGAYMRKVEVIYVV